MTRQRLKPCKTTSNSARANLMSILVTGGAGDDALVSRLIAEREVSAIIHFAASIVVPDSMSDPLGYYRNNTVNSRALIESAVRGGVKQFIFSSTAAVYGNPAKVPVSEDDTV